MFSKLILKAAHYPKKNTAVLLDVAVVEFQPKKLKKQVFDHNILGYYN